MAVHKARTLTMTLSMSIFFKILIMLVVVTTSLEADKIYISYVGCYFFDRNSENSFAGRYFPSNLSEKTCSSFCHEQAGNSLPFGLADDNICLCYNTSTKFQATFRLNDGYCQSSCQNGGLESTCCGQQNSVAVFDYTASANVSSCLAQDDQEVKVNVVSTFLCKGNCIYGVFGTFLFMAIVCCLSLVYMYHHIRRNRNHELPRPPSRTSSQHRSSKIVLENSELGTYTTCFHRDHHNQSDLNAHRYLDGTHPHCKKCFQAVRKDDVRVPDSSTSLNETIELY